MNILLSLVLMSFIETGSVGFTHTPLFDGISVKVGQIEGLRGNLLISFGSGETQIDSSAYHYYITPSTIYSYTYYRPYYWINYGLRAQYHFKYNQWYQTYLGLGVEGKKDSRWYTEYGSEQNDSIYTHFPAKATADYYGPTLSAGIDFFPIALFDAKTRFAKAVSFNIEICSYYLIKHEFTNTDLHNRWFDFGFYPERTFSGIGTGIGIQYNW
ncbi:MAG: hypothetical protein KGZ86_05860 [Candidatus Latescibacteria bacterium]|nr:hypothetical protein [Candidatus Latescibacterota bacterium]